MVKYRIAFSDKFVLLVILDTDLMMTSDRVIIIHNVVTSDIDSDQHVYLFYRVADPDTQTKTRARVFIKVGCFITLRCPLPYCSSVFFGTSAQQHKWVWGS